MGSAGPPSPTGTIQGVTLDYSSFPHVSEYVPHPHILRSTSGSSTWNDHPQCRTCNSVRFVAVDVAKEGYESERTSTRSARGSQVMWGRLRRTQRIGGTSGDAS